MHLSCADTHLEVPFLVYVLLTYAACGGQVKGDKQGAWKVLEQVARVNGAALPSGSLIPSQSSQRVPNSLGNKLALLVIFLLIVVRYVATGSSKLCCLLYMLVWF
jgi:hypothetical protein